jgi:hypothetical protein
VTTRRVLIGVAAVTVLAVGGAVVGHARGGADQSSPMVGTPAAGLTPLSGSGSPRPGSATTVVADPGADATPPGSQLAAARSAGVAAVERTRDVFDAGDISRRDLIAEFATDRFAPVLAAKTSEQVVDLLFGLRKATGRYVEVHVVAQPVTATATATGPDRVRVDVWTVTVMLAEGDAPVPEQWSTIHLNMVTVDGRWLVDDWSMSPGPSPAPAPESSFGSADEVATVIGWPSATGGQ